MESRSRIRSTGTRSSLLVALFTLVTVGCDSTHSIRVRVEEQPNPVAYNEWVDIVVRAENQDQPLSGASVRLWSHDGVYAATGQNLVEGQTDAKGEFRARYREVTDRNIRKYDGEITVKKEGLNNGWRKWSAKVESPGPKPRSGEALRAELRLDRDSTVLRQPVWFTVVSRSSSGQIVPFAEIDLVSTEWGHFNGSNPSRGQTDLEGTYYRPWFPTRKGTHRIEARVTKEGWGDASLCTATITVR